MPSCQILQEGLRSASVRMQTHGIRFERTVKTMTSRCDFDACPADNEPAGSSLRLLQFGFRNLHDALNILLTPGPQNDFCHDATRFPIQFRLPLLAVPWKKTISNVPLRISLSATPWENKFVDHDDVAGVSSSVFFNEQTAY